jgi:hypothetical protein
MTDDDKERVARWESLAREAIRTAIGAANGTTMRERAVDALRELRDNIDPAILLDLIREWRAPG